MKVEKNYEFWLLSVGELLRGEIKNYVIECEGDVYWVFYDDVEDELIEIGRNGVKVNDVDDDIMYGLMLMVKKCRGEVSIVE